ERGLRPGTENVASIVGLGAACRIAARALTAAVATMTELSDLLLDRLRGEVPGLALAGNAEHRLPNTVNVLFPGASGREILAACPRVAASTGSACHAGSEEPSPVLSAMGIPREQALGAVRLSLGRATTPSDVETAATSLAAAWRLVTGRVSRPDA